MTQPTKFRKRPVVIEAMEWDGSAAGASPIIEWVLSNGGTARFHAADPPRMHGSACRCDGRGIVPGKRSAIACPETEPKGTGTPAFIAIDTLEGTMRAERGWRVIRGVEGEFYPCAPSIFEVTYEESSDGNS